MTHPHRLVIIGGGFAGLSAAFGLRRAAVDITLVDRRNFHLFQPLLYQVATGGLSPANISAPLRSVLKRQKNARVQLAEVCDFDLVNRRVILTDEVLDYDTLVVATGATHQYFGNDHWESLAPGLKTIEDATEIRRRVFQAFEAAERAERPEKVQQLLTFVAVGGGPTGVELAGIDAPQRDAETWDRSLDERLSGWSVTVCQVTSDAAKALSRLLPGLSSTIAFFWTTVAARLAAWQLPVPITT